MSARKRTRILALPKILSLPSIASSPGLLRNASRTAAEFSAIPGRSPSVFISVFNVLTESIRVQGPALRRRQSLHRPPSLPAHGLGNVATQPYLLHLLFAFVR